MYTGARASVLLAIMHACESAGTGGGTVKVLGLIYYYIGFCTGLGHNRSRNFYATFVRILATNVNISTGPGSPFSRSPGFRIVYGGHASMLKKFSLKMEVFHVTIVLAIASRILIGDVL